MSQTLFLILTISTQAVFLVTDMIYARMVSADEKREKLKLRSILFIGLFIIIYGIIQFGGLSLIPKTEILINWMRNVTPDWNLFNWNSNDFSLVGWLILGTFAFYMSGFWDYSVHRFMSHSKALFFTHEYHHLPNRMILALPGLSVRPFVVFAVFPATLGTLFVMIFILKLFGLENLNLMPMVYVVIFLQSIILSITHSEFFMNQWWMFKSFKYLALTSPQDHEIHHTVDLRGNYGNYTLLWDKLMNTYIDPSLEENKNHKLGLNYDQDFLGALTAGFVKLPKKIRNKYQVERYCNIEESK